MGVKDYHKLFFSCVCVSVCVCVCVCFVRWCVSLWVEKETHPEVYCHSPSQHEIWALQRQEKHCSQSNRCLPKEDIAFVTDVKSDTVAFKFPSIQVTAHQQCPSRQQHGNTIHYKYNIYNLYARLLAPFFNNNGNNNKRSKFLVVFNGYLNNSWLIYTQVSKEQQLNLQSNSIYNNENVD